ncbi:MAG: hypothetical protein CR988_02170 [Treponema sp.]|nr:MAG: hypothetical protein CR988_02170 [Treponema sp.]
MEYTKHGGSGMKAIIHTNDLSYTTDFFYEMKSEFESKMIFIISFILLLFFAWVFLGKRESVVHTVGIVRPSDNVSNIKIRRAGEIENVFFVDGQTVKKGDVILKLKTINEEVTEKNILSKLKLLLEKEEDVEAMIESFYKNKNCVSKKRIIAWSRVNNFEKIKKSLIELCEIHQKYLDDEKKLPAEIQTREKLLNLDRNLKTAELNLSRFNDKFLTSLLQEKESLSLQRQNLEEVLIKVQTEIEMATIKAPIDGTVIMSSYLNKGDFVFANKDVLTIIPKTELGYTIKMKLPSSKAGRVEKGMKVKLKFPAFPVYEYSPVEGEVVNISADAMGSQNGTFYVVTVKPNTVNLKNKKGKVFSLKSGLQTDAKIIVNDERIFEYILKKLEIRL